jgi:hypothetical protein
MEHVIKKTKLLFTLHANDTWDIRNGSRDIAYTCAQRGQRCNETYLTSRFQYHTGPSVSLQLSAPLVLVSED